MTCQTNRTLMTTKQIPYRMHFSWDLMCPWMCLFESECVLGPCLKIHNVSFPVSNVYGKQGCIFWSSSSGVFSGYSGFLPSFIGYGFSQWNKANIKAISTLSNLIAELSLRTKWHVIRHVARDKHSMYCTWFAHDSAQASWVYMLETVCGTVRRL